MAYLDAESGEWIPVAIHESVPPDITFAVSETIYNLKVALDYATYALFKQALAEGRIPPAIAQSPNNLRTLEKHVQFPIMDCPKKAKRWRRTWGYWLRKCEWTVIERTQPYRRPLMHLLGDRYHNLDKHRDFQRIVVEVDMANATVRPREGLRFGEAFEAEPWAERPVAMYVGGAVEVALEDGLPLVESLQVLESEVAALIDELAAAFERS